MDKSAHRHEDIDAKPAPVAKNPAAEIAGASRSAFNSTSMGESEHLTDDARCFAARGKDFSRRHTRASRRRRTGCRESARPSSQRSGRRFVQTPDPVYSRMQPALSLSAQQERVRAQQEAQEREEVCA
jgi:hypothetical protein